MSLLTYCVAAVTEATPLILATHENGEVLNNFNQQGTAEIKDPAFQSTTLSQTVARGVSGRANKHLIRIHTQHSAKDVGVFTSHPNESEILFPPNTTWQVFQVTSGLPAHPYEYIFDVNEVNLRSRRKQAIALSSRSSSQFK